VIKILGRPTSSNVQKVLWCCGELAIDFVHEPEYGGAYGKVDEPAYRALNPNGLVPTLIEDGFVLWESNAIVRYLAAAYGAGTLSPTDLRERASAEKWMDWHQTSLDEVLFPAFFELVRKPPAARDQSVIDRAVRDSSPKLAILDGALAATGFVAGGRLTIGDIVFGPALHRWLNLPIERPRFPNIEAWYARMKARPPFAKYVAIPLS
jgi:glutathione S-transferase